MKAKTNKLKVSKALEEVWEWKEKAWEETRNMDFAELKACLDRSMQETAKSINAKIVANDNGSYRFTR